MPIELTCGGCGGLFSVKPSHAKYRVYCSKGCMGAAFSQNHVGEANPNWRGDRRVKACARCGEEFKTSIRTRKYCGRRCSDLAKRIARERPLKQMVLRSPAGQPRQITCAECGTVYSRKASYYSGSKYCSWACKAKAQTRITGSLRHNWKPPSQVCEWCGGLFKNPSKKARFCSPHCFYVWEGANWEVDELGRRFGSRVDKNQKEIVAALEMAGVCVMDLSALRRGIPDLLAATKHKTAMLEVKNPNWAYGRAGLNKFQKAFADGWPGEIYVVTSAEEALAVFGIGDGKCPLDMSYWARLPEDEKRRRTHKALANAEKLSQTSC